MLCLVGCLLVLAAAAFADSYEEGRGLYIEGKYAEAAVKLEQATREDPNSAKAWWQLNFAYGKLGRTDDALNAAKKAGELDPNYTFTTGGSAKFNTVLSDLQKKKEQHSRDTKPNADGSTPPSGSTRGGSGAGNLAKQLTEGDIFVEPGIAIDVDRLRTAVNALRPDAIVKVAVFNSESDSNKLDAEADRLRTQLPDDKHNLYVILASKRAVVVSSDKLDRAKRRELTNAVALQMSGGDYTGGLVKLANSLVLTRESQTNRIRSMWVIILVLVGGGLAAWLLVRAIHNARQMAQAREPLNHMKSDVVSGLNYLDESASLVDAQTSGYVKQMRVSAGARLDEAVRIMNRARNAGDLGQAQGLLDQALVEISNGRSAIDRAMGGGGSGSGTADNAPRNPFSRKNASGKKVSVSVGDHDSSAPPVYPTTAAANANVNWQQVPDNERGLCFFCSRPAYMRDLTPVTVNLDGQQQKVLACPDDLNIIKTGQMPQIRAFQNNGQYVPWYAYQSYNPWTDYYGRGYGTGSFLTDMIVLSAIDSMYWHSWNHPVGWGWGGGYGWGGYGNSYAFYPEHDHYRDYYGSSAAGYGYGSNDYNSDFDRNNSDRAVGSDFLSDSPGDRTWSGSDRS